jgi:hypothetical protein
MSTITELRLQLLANGYSPIRNRDKRTFMPGWPGVELTPAEIESWGRRHKRDTATGLRVENGLAVIDLDVNDKTAINLIADRIFEAIPELGDVNANLLVRTGKGAKEAWFVRTDEEFGRIHSRSWLRPGEGLDDGTHRVEIFGGASARQFGAFGPHTVADDGTVEINYGWPERSPADTPQSELPELTKAQFFRIADIVEEVLQELGWTQVERSSKGENDAVRVYDLTEEMSFDLSTGDTVSLQQLRDMASVDGSGLRCSASWLEGAEAVNRTRCLVTVTRTGNLAIWESASGVTHCEASLKRKEYNIDHDRLAEQLRELKDKRRNNIHTNDGLTAAFHKLVAGYAYCMHNGPADVVPIWSSSMDDAIPLKALRQQLLPNAEEEQGPRGGVRVINPIDLWSRSTDRVHVRGMRMRPDMPRPIYEEDGEKWVNIYSPPRHDAEGGSAVGGLLLLEQLYPDPAERLWFTRWLAHKLRYPHIPGPGVVSVARAFGTGRGRLAKLIGKLFGPRYVQELPFEAFAGKTYQSQYNEWLATALVVIVNESSESDGSVFQTKRNTYERLKELVDPEPKERAISVKSRPNYRALSFASFFIATNHEDALPIPADDRRFGVLSNGEPRDEAFWQEIMEWMESDANVAAFYRHLMSLDLGDYSPFALPPKTEAKAAMVEAGRSDLDKALVEAIAAMHTDVMVMEQLVPMVERVARQEGYDLPQAPGDKRTAIIRRAAQKMLYKVGERDGTHSKLSIENKRYYVWARNPTARKVYSTCPQEELRRDVLRNGTPSGVDTPSKLALLRQPKQE